MKLRSSFAEISFVLKEEKGKTNMKLKGGIRKGRRIVERNNGKRKKGMQI